MLKKMMGLSLAMVMMVCSVGILASAQVVSYDTVLHYVNFNECTTANFKTKAMISSIDLDSGNINEAWYISSVGGRNVLRAWYGSNKKFLFGNPNWTDYTFEMNYAIDVAAANIASENYGIGAFTNFMTQTELNAAGVTGATGSKYHEYAFRTNTVVAGQSFKAYSKQASLVNAVQKWRGATDATYWQYDTQAKTSTANPLYSIVPNIPQKIKIRTETISENASGFTMKETVTVNDTELPYNTIWYGSGAQYMKKGSIGVKNYSTTAKYSIYDMKVIPNQQRQTDFQYKDATNNSVTKTTIPASSKVTISGSMGKVHKDNIVYSPTIVSVIYMGNTLYDIAYTDVLENEFEKPISQTLNTPSDTSGCSIKTFVLSNLNNNIMPLMETITLD